MNWYHIVSIQFNLVLASHKFQTMNWCGHLFIFKKNIATNTKLMLNVGHWINLENGMAKAIETMLCSSAVVHHHHLKNIRRDFTLWWWVYSINSVAVVVAAVAAVAVVLFLFISTSLFLPLFHRFSRRLVAICTTIWIFTWNLLHPFFSCWCVCVCVLLALASSISHSLGWIHYWRHCLLLSLLLLHIHLENTHASLK